MKGTSIKFKVTREETHSISVPATSGASSGELLTPHLLAPRNSLSSVNECSTRRRRPITLKIMPRLSMSLPARSTSAPASTTETEWPAVRSLMNYGNATDLVVGILETSTQRQKLSLARNFPRFDRFAKREINSGESPCVSSTRPQRKRSAQARGGSPLTCQSTCASALSGSLKRTLHESRIYYEVFGAAGGNAVM
ncbi:hypothetical protein Zmor_024864 [Zophobas morio]|uniref:Uncharacterized protein n=1 Tax=Zophobas morio TaxID=2755281 RepID=A0AA38HR63_9CUCU|nr:hypothetical protein Zmor_024864 [Zophobas morio]